MAVYRLAEAYKLHFWTFGRNDKTKKDALLYLFMPL